MRQQHYIEDRPMERGTCVSIVGGVLFMSEVARRDPFQQAVPVHQGARLPRQFRPRGVEADGLKYYQERNGDYLSVDPSTLDYYLKTQGVAHMEGRATCIRGSVSSVCTTGLSLEFLRTKCKRVPKSDIPAEWLEML